MKAQRIHGFDVGEGGEREERKYLSNLLHKLSARWLKHSSGSRRFKLMYLKRAGTHHMDSGGEEVCRFDRLLLMLDLSLQLGRTDFVLGQQDGGRKLRLLLEEAHMIWDVMGMTTLHLP